MLRWPIICVEMRNQSEQRLFKATVCESAIANAISNECENYEFDLTKHSYTLPALA